MAEPLHLPALGSQAPRGTSKCRTLASVRLGMLASADVLEVVRGVPLYDHHALLRVASDPTSGLVPLACPAGLNLFAYTACLRGSPSSGVVVRYFSVDVELLFFVLCFRSATQPFSGFQKCTPSIWCYGSVALHLSAFRPSALDLLVVKR